VLFDDREDSSPGLKFNDADLIGIPYQIIVGGKKSKEGELELKLRDNGNSRIIKEESIEKELKI
jgi:prolyl-tRNA synthetase